MMTFAKWGFQIIVPLNNHVTKEEQRKAYFCDGLVSFVDTATDTKYIVDCNDDVIWYVIDNMAYCEMKFPKFHTDDTMDVTDITKDMLTRLEPCNMPLTIYSAITSQEVLAHGTNGNGKICLTMYDTDTDEVCEWCYDVNGEPNTDE